MNVPLAVLNLFTCRSLIHFKLSQILNCLFIGNLCKTILENWLLLKPAKCFISDVNECEKAIGGLISNGGCQHKCNNTVGSFNCSCNDGFKLAEDLATCEGKKVLNYFF